MSYLLVDSLTELLCDLKKFNYELENALNDFTPDSNYFLAKIYGIELANKLIEFKKDLGFLTKNNGEINLDVRSKIRLMRDSTETNSSCLKQTRMDLEYQVKITKAAKWALGCISPDLDRDYLRFVEYSITKGEESWSSSNLGTNISRQRP